MDIKNRKYNKRVFNYIGENKGAIEDLNYPIFDT